MKVLGAVLGVIGIIVGLALILSLPTMWLWNWLMPLIFGLVKINIWQAIGLNILSGILFRTTHTNNKTE